MIESKPRAEIEPKIFIRSEISDIDANFFTSSNKILDNLSIPIGFYFLQYHYSTNITENINAEGNLNNDPEFVFNNGIIIRPEYRKKGYAKSVYKKIITNLNNVPLFSGLINLPNQNIKMLNEGSIGLWESLVNEGYANRIYDQPLTKVIGYISKTSDRYESLKSKPIKTDSDYSRIINLYKNNLSL